MLKLTGAIFILIAGFLSGSLITEKKKKRLEIITALIDLTEHIRSSIQTARLPLNEIYQLFNNDVLESCGFTDSLKNRGLFYALETIKGTIGQHVYDSMLVTSSKLGGIDTTEQIGLCDYTIKKLQNEQQKEREQFTEKQRLYKTLPILCALSVIILIL